MRTVDVYERIRKAYYCGRAEHSRDQQATAPWAQVGAQSPRSRGPRRLSSIASWHPIAIIAIVAMDLVWGIVYKKTNSLSAPR